MAAIKSLIILLLCFPSLLLAQEAVSGELLVKLKPGVKFPNTKGYVKSATASGVLSQKRSWSLLNLHLLKIGAGQNLPSIISNVLSDPDTEYAEPNYVLKISQVASLGLLGGSGFSQCSAPIGADEAWSIVTEGLPPTTIAIIDTGVDTNHEVFTGAHALWKNPNEIEGNGIDDDKNGYIDDIYGWNFVANNNQPLDDNGHGTHVAGIALGATQDIFASPLEAAKIRIMSLKFLDAEGSGTTSAAIDAIIYATKNGAHVLNNSWGGSVASQALLDAIRMSDSAGKSFVAAAGNQSSNNDTKPTYPASYDVGNIVAVAATTDLDELATFSNFGALSVHLGAPGKEIVSTLPSNSYGKLNGTSMAAPFVAGTIALMMREKYYIKGTQGKSLLLESAEPVASLMGKTSTEARLNIYNAVLQAQNAEELISTDLASSGSNNSGVVFGGCGLIKESSSGRSGGAPGALAACILLTLPLLILRFLRKREGA